VHIVTELLQALVAPLVSAANALTPLLAELAHRPVQNGDFMLSAFVVSVAVIGIALCWWAAFTRARWSNFRIDAGRRESRLSGAVRLRDMLLRESNLCLVLLGHGQKTPVSYGGGGDFLQDCMRGPDAALFATALDALLKSGFAFDLQVRATDHRRILAQGKPMGGAAAIYFEELRAEHEPDYREALNVLPTPVWVRRNDLALAWANRAFLEVVQAQSLDSALAGNAFIEKSERDLAVGARDGAVVTGVRRFATRNGERRALSINLNKLADATLLGMAVDVTETVEAEARLKLHIDTYAGLLDRIPAAIANFGADRRLTHYNSAYAQLWCLESAWLDSHPPLDEILDRLRRAGRLPEQRDFRRWKDEHMRPFSDRTRYVDEVWHTSNEKSIKVQAQPDLEGGVFYIFEDISEHERLTARLSLLSRVQRATLDAIDEPIAIFDPSGRLATHNLAFAASWQLTEDELAEAPHFTRVASLCIARKGRDQIWDIVSAALASGEIEGYAEWGKVTRADGRVIVVSLSHLPNGAIVVMFKDVTDLERFSEELGHGASPAAA